MADKYTNILVAVDDSEQANKAFKEAVAIAKRNDAVLCILSTFAIPTYDSLGLSIQSIIDMAEKETEQLVREKTEQAKNSGLKNVIYRVVQGHPKHIIVKMIKSEGYDLVVMGSSGKGAVERTLLGSNTSFVVNHAPCDVLVVKDKS
ncbi:universal stress protein [Enterococcus sp. CWB-B31]|uniref:universal stress protein n=1 Tax=Enterococcus sp. CWB-B31 TaxID=2885159 RepID=UPI003B63A410|nr:universal stress protein [Enterococcus sp. CWB-B31]